jgi:hypothetical protein
LQDAQNLRLHGKRHVADLIEENRAAIRIPKSARAVSTGAGESAFNVTEQFALQQLRRNRRAIHGDKGLCIPPAVHMQRPRHQLFACTSLAQDQHGGVAVGRKADGLLNAAHSLACADQGAGSMLRRIVDFSHGFAPRQLAGQKRLQFFAPDRLGQMVEGTEPHGFDGVLGACEGGQHRDRRRVRARPNPT